ncbi:glycosyltransferase involved in cell wall biosynthesis [Flavobacterium aquaticum]|uniref:Glycosyltransferase involved in cell wall biosynthesis n=1 Tax=Flavobacterium aquaticum TaxID=1236486 RepID=A0A327YNM8_9FLAO|nr:glycosyltransferase family 4 protein [Flavobacterium aquaticum]RAK22714.1 glycosyltransferase involved in cell wall biosynthesis [Flavobacterium aquaticum]
MKKKICFVVSAPITAKVFLIKHFEYLSKEFDITLVANFETQADFEVPFVKNTKHIAIHRSINPLKDFLALIQLYFFFKKESFHVVHSVTPKAGLLAMMSSWLSRIPTRIHIFTGQVWHTQSGFKKQFLKFLDRLLVWFTTHILVDGQSQRQFLIANKIITDKNSKVLGKGSISGVDVQKFNPSSEIRNLYREQLNFQNNDVVFAFLGRMNTDKGILDLAKAFQKLHADFPNVKLLLIGFDEENMQEKIRQIQTENIIYFGPTPKPQEVLQAADVFCLPSYREGFGTSVIEASLLELPIICSDTYGLAETIIENKTGLRHEVKNVDQLYNQMKLLVQNEETRTVLGKNGRQYVLEHFSADEISLQWLTFYKDILK